jgi:periplasmic protein TonB
VLLRPFFVSWIPSVHWAKKDRILFQMILWLGLAISLLLHAALFCIPIRVQTAEELPIEELQFVFMGGGGELSSQAAQGPGNPAPKQEMTQPADEPEETPPPTEVPKAIVIPKEVPQVTRPKQPERPKKPAKERVSPQEKPPQSDSTSEAPVAQGVPSEQATVSGSGSSPVGSAGASGPVEAAFGSGNGPRFVRQVLPKYPHLARKLAKEGIVHLLLTINEKGELLSVKVTQTGGADFDEEAVRAVKQSSFSPARKDGMPVACRAHLPIRFVLRSSGND